MSPMRVRAVIALVLLVLTPLLAACNDDEDLPKAGDIIRARLDNQFKKGQESEVALPTGKLLIHSGEPVKTASSDDTRTRTAVDAPSGAVMVPITWQYDPWTSGKLDGIFATDDTPIVDMVSDGEHYRLTPPERDTDGAESFYVVVDGDGSDRSLEITIDGVAQTVDLRTGDRDEGDAAGLYDITDAKLDKQRCDEGRWFTTKDADADFSCEIHGPVLTPYAAGKWAPSGTTWLTMTVTTSIRAYGVSGGLGAGARYLAGSVKGRPTIDGEKPEKVLSTDDELDVCPLVAQQRCGWSKQVVFAVPADDPEQGPLDLEMSYHLTLLTAYGNDFDPPKHQDVTADEKLKIWK